MSRELLLVFLGLLVAIVPFSGVPYSIVTILVPVFGILMAAISATLWRKRVQKGRTSSESEDQGALY